MLWYRSTVSRNAHREHDWGAVAFAFLDEAWFVQPGAAMSGALPVVCVARHGQTAWTISHQDTGVGDLPLTAAGEAEAIRPDERLAGRTFAARWLAAVPRRLSRWRVAGRGCKARRPRYAAGAGDRGVTSCFFPAATSSGCSRRAGSGLRRLLAGTSPRHGQPERDGLRARSIRAGHPAPGRNA